MKCSHRQTVNLNNELGMESVNSDRQAQAFSIKN